MNSRERVLAVMNRKVPDRIHKDLSWGLCPALEEEFKRRTGCDDYYDYFDLDVRIGFRPDKAKKRLFPILHRTRSGKRLFD